MKPVKRKGGAAREKEKKKKQLLEVSKKCAKLNSFFSIDTSGRYLLVIYL
jgi:hypothetical protein